MLAAAGILLAIGAAVFLSLTVGRQLLRLARQPEAFRAWIDGCGPWAPLCLIGLMCFQVVVAVLPGEPIEIGAGVAFGVWQGLGLCLIGAALGSTIIFLFTKKLGIKLVEVFVPLEKIRQLKFLQNNRRLHVLVFLLFWIPGVPKDVLTYFVGLTEMKLPAFLAISTVARIPSALMSTSGGAALGSGRYALYGCQIAVNAIVFLSMMGYYGVDLTSTVIAIIVGGVMLGVNVTYFNKRKHLFS